MNINYNERIELLKDKLHVLEQCNRLYNYFYPIKKSKNSYVVEMRRLVGQQLYDIGMSKVDISGIFGKDHSTVVHLLGIESSIDVQKEVADKYKLWIELGLYPDSIFVLEVSDIHFNGHKHTLDYILTDELTYDKNSKEKYMSRSISKYFKDRMMNLISSEDYISSRASLNDAFINKVKFSHPDNYKLIEEKESAYKENMLIINSKNIINYDRHI
jgi:hypothetical protein